MTQQPTLFSREAQVPPKSSDPNPDSNHREPSSDQRRQAARQIPRWLQYIELSVRVVVRLYLGLVLVVLPWTHFWDNNHLLSFVPYLPALALSGVVRGVVSGLGLLNIWIAVSDAIHFREN
jgi:formate-dependent nitrite reductase membrane component NrfD